MKKILFLSSVLALVLTGCSKNEESANENETPTDVTITENELKEAFYYTFPLVVMDATESVETNAETFVPGVPRAPVNQLIHTVSTATADSKQVVTPNVDTYYSRLWLDLEAEPIVLEYPDVTDRFCNIQILDAWTNTVKVIYAGGTYVFAKKGQTANIPAGATLVEMPTNMGWCIFRILNQGEGDYPNVKKIQDAMKVCPLSAYGDDSYVAPKGTYDAARNVVPSKKCLAMSLEDYFAKANALMEKNPPLSFDTEIITRLKKLGVGPGLKLAEIEKGAEMFANIKDGFRADATVILSNRRKSIGGIWSYNIEPVGDFGTDYDYRAATALIALGANTNEVAIYPVTYKDSDGQTLNGENVYTLHFKSLPPVEQGGFWSVTAYGDDDYLIKNDLNRYNVTDRSNYTLNGESLDVTLSFKEPTDGTFWLPVGDKGFHLFMRLYLPDLKALDNWTPPTITKK